MTLVELSYFPGEGSHRSPLIVNPTHVVMLVAADGGRDGQQCWLRLRGEGDKSDFLIRGNLYDIAAELGRGLK